jgi:hypothetical protein
MEISQKQIDIKIKNILDLTTALQNYQPNYIGNKENEKLRLWAKIINEDIHFIVEFIISKNNGCEQS